MKRTNKKKLNIILRNINLLTATLLLNGQVSITGVFIQTDGAFSVSIGGPITGGFRIVSKSGSKSENITITIIDFVIAIFLILDLLNVQGTYFTSGRFSIVVGGPLFGGDKTEIKEVNRLNADFNTYVRRKRRKGR
ncbi:hypothetical protein [Paenibacillus sp. Marseille-Q4541]|uniref:hypothetical protein n=1 Tax=Paenibacillus sp. Marseille-Q4541 TaxID=2831522 RepID=UPI001BA9B5A4|nr:hypothetical protein [Paenibacillus sp. Marseille-Q4541]